MSNKKIVYIQGNNSRWYDEAIFIMKNEIKDVPSNIIAEAEKIIEDYMARKTLTPKTPERPLKTVSPSQKNNASGQIGIKTKNAVTDIVLNICLILSCVLLGFILRGIML